MALFGNFDRISEQVDINLSSSLDEVMVINSQKHECPLCCNVREIFYCKDCINQGDYYRTTITPNAERYIDKHLRLLKLKKDKREVEFKCENILQSQLHKIKLMSEIEDHKKRIDLLKCGLKKSQEKIAHKKTLIEQLKCDNVKSVSYTLPLYRTKVNRMQLFVIHHNNDVASRRQKLTEIQEELKKVIRTSILQLVNYIFPISVMQPPRSESGSETYGTVSALNEAASLAYMGGRWVTTDLSGQMHHSIVAPTLPSSGDYSAYNDWVSASKDGVPMSNIESVCRNQAYNISAALTYTTQLINIIAFYLGIKLPNKLCYSDLCSTALSERKFARRVSQLNLNVLHLCLSQNVAPERLHPTQTLQNILLLLESKDLGRIGPMEVDPVVASELEDQLRIKVDTTNDDSGSDEDCDLLHQDWETVPHMPSLEGSPGSHTPSYLPPPPQPGVNIVTSAAASLASLWRGFTTNR